MGAKARVKYPVDLGMSLQKLGNRHCGLFVALHAQVQGLKAAEVKPAVKGARHRTDGFLDVFHLFKYMLVIGDDHAADDLVVPSEILGRAVHHDIRAELKGSEKDRRGKCGIDAQQDVVLAGDFDHFLKVAHLQQRIGRGFDPEHPGLWGNHTAHGICVRGVDVADIDALLTGDVIQKAGHTTIYIIAADNVIPLGQQLEACVDSRHTACETHGVLAAVDRGKVFLKHLAGGVRRARVVKAQVTSDLRQYIGRGFIDRRKDRTRGGIRADAGADNLGIKFQCVSP